MPRLLSDWLRNFLSVPSQRWQHRSSCNRASQLLIRLFRMVPLPRTCGSAVGGSNKTCAGFVDEGEERVGRSWAQTHHSPHPCCVAASLSPADR